MTGLIPLSPAQNNTRTLTTTLHSITHSLKLGKMNQYEKAFDKFGNQHQKLKLIEEMAELTQAIIKDSNISEEIADVQIVLDQIKLLYPNWKSWEQVKIQRLKEICNFEG